MAFLDLPAEPRNAIYELALSQTTKISLNGQEVTPGMLQVNKQIRAETTLLHQPVNLIAKIEDNNMDGPITWLNNRTEAENQAIASLTFDCYASKTSIHTMKKLSLIHI